MDNATAERAIPADFEATLTYFRSYEQTMFVQDGDQAIFVLATTEAPLLPGDRIRIRGITHPGLRPYVVSHDVTFVDHGSLPHPHPAVFKELIDAADDCMLVTVRGRVRAAVDEVKTDVRGAHRPRQNAVRIQMLSEGGMVEALIDRTDGRNLDQYIDAEVAITGVAGGRFDGKLQQTGVALHVTSLDDISILHPAATNPWSLPATPFNEIMRAYDVHDSSARVHVHGSVTFYQPGTAVVLQDGPRSLWVSTLNSSRLEIGEVVDAIGFPDVHSGFLTLNHASIKQRDVRAPVEPAAANWSDLAASRKVFDLVTIDGEVVTGTRETGQDKYVIRTQGHLTTAVFRHSVLHRFPDEPMPEMRLIPTGSQVRITGVCIPEDSNPFAHEVPFNILLRSPGDIAIVADPPWLNVRRLTILVGWLVFAVFIFGVREWRMERRVRRQNAALAYIEKRRGRILEDINNSRPLAEILERITELVSARLAGAACWCAVAGGARLGNAPTKGTSGLRVVEKQIPGRSGAPLGSLFAAFAAGATPSSAETETLSMAAGLAALAIETSRLYSDLVHRSEFDLLTDVQNRFSLEKFLDAQIGAARQSATLLGILYIDLDRFKQINDLYGHHVGDRYLQEVAARMKQQLRPGDMLARLGGDEFAVIVTAPRSRTHMNEIAMRLARCFEQPIDCDATVLHGSASIGVAMYPDDGSTRDALLKAADAAMYVQKNARAGDLAGSGAHRDI